MNCTINSASHFSGLQVGISPISLVQLAGSVRKFNLNRPFILPILLQSLVEAEFGDSAGGERIARIRDWIFERFRYAAEGSNSQTTAVDTFVRRQGVCRDFAHVLIALPRASSIPARFVSAYAPYFTPQDFHAVAEVYLDHTWHLVDATGMAASNQIARIGIGLDAAEVSFLSSFGPLMFGNQSVQVRVEE